MGYRHCGTAGLAIFGCFFMSYSGSGINLFPLCIHLPAHSHSERKQMVVQVVGFLTIMWETQMELLASGFDLAKVRYLGYQSQVLGK